MTVPENENVDNNEIINKAFEKMVRVRENFLLTNPFFAILALRQEIVEASGWLPTMAVDGKHLFFNAKFVMSLSVEEVKFVICHEILHLAYGHLVRVNYGNHKERDPKLFNIACDYCVNRDAKNANVGEVPKKIGILYDAKYEHKIAEEIYSELLKNPEENKKKQTLDEHLDLSGSDEGQPSPPKIEKDSNGRKRCQKRPVYDENTVNQNMDKFREDLLIASEEASGGSGDIPSEIQRIIDNIKKPKINWRHYLKKLIQSHIKSNLDWSTPSRKSFDSRFHLPGNDNDDMISIHLSIDTSGSMSNDMLSDFLGEIYGIVNQFPNFIIRIWTFDTSVYNYKEYTSDNVRDIKKYKIMGNGGTEFMVNWDFMKKNKIRPDLFVMFTDGVPCGSWGVPKFCETIYVIHSNPNIKAPVSMGKTLSYERR